MAQFLCNCLMKYQLKLLLSMFWSIQSSTKVALDGFRKCFTNGLAVSQNFIAAVHASEFFLCLKLCIDDMENKYLSEQWLGVPRPMKGGTRGNLY